MASFSKLGIILCCVFGFIFLGLVAKLYYFFWWKNKSNKNTDQNNKHSNWLFLSSFLFRRKSLLSAVNNYSTEEGLSSSIEHDDEKRDLEAGNGGDDETESKVEESVETELFRLHNLCGPPRYLFTIKEETKEDLMEEEDSVVVVVPAEYDSYSGNNISQQQESRMMIQCKDSDSDSELEFNKFRSSPPPTFKFMRDAEEKLIKRLIAEANNMGRFRDCSSNVVLEDDVEEKYGSFIGFLNSKKEREKGIQNQPTIQTKGLGKVTPLANSPPPTTFTPELVKS